MCCLFYSLFARTIKITAIKVMFNTIEMYKVKIKYVINSTINTTSLPIAKAMKLSGNTSDCLFPFPIIYTIQYNLIKNKRTLYFIYYKNVFKIE